MRVLVVGCGFVGMPLALELVRQGHQVVGVRRSSGAAAEMTAVGVEPLITDISRPDFIRPAGRFDWIVFVAADRTRNPESVRRVYGQGMDQLLQWLSTVPPSKFVCASDISIYGQQDGSVVKESSPAQGESALARAWIDAEALLFKAAKAGFPSVILRVAEIYGPDRSRLFEAFLNNQVKLAGRGHRFLNLIHRDDVVGAILAALQGGRAGETYNVVDQEPVTEVHFFTWLSETLGKSVPPFVPETTQAESEPGEFRANQRVSNRRLTMELGYRLKYPTFRQGFTAEIKRLTDAGLLDIQPEER